MTGDDGANGTIQHQLNEPTGPLVFVSHDSRDEKVAEAFCALLSNVSAGMLQTFRSSDKKGSQGFEYGVEWYPELMRRLEVSCDVVCLLTRRSLNRPWLLYEAGVAKGKLDVPVHGLALGVPLSKASTGPFAQFQNCDGAQESISKLVVQLVKRLPHAAPNPTLVDAQVGEFLQKVAPALADEKSTDRLPGPFEDEPTAKLFEEIKVMFQDLPTRVEKAATAPSTSSRHTRGRYQQAVLDEVMHSTRRVRESQYLGTRVLMMASLLTEEAPWLLPMATAIYNAELSGDRNVTRAAMMKFTESLDRLSFMARRDGDGLLQEALHILGREMTREVFHLPFEEADISSKRRSTPDAEEK